MNHPTIWFEVIPADVQKRIAVFGLSKHESALERLQPELVPACFVEASLLRVPLGVFHAAKGKSRERA